MIRSIIRNIQFRIILFSLIVAIITLRDNEGNIVPGIDGAFRWAFNYLVAFDQKALTHIRYTIGPLCLLKWPAPIGNHIFISSLFYLLTGWLFTWLFTFFYSRYRNTDQLIIPLLTSTIFIMVVNVDILIAGCILLPMLYFKFLDRKGYIFISALLTIIGLYIKTSIFIILFCAWTTFYAYLIIKKEWKYLISILAGCIAAFFIVGLLLFGNITGTVNYALNNLSFASKYSDILSLYPYNNWTSLSICFAAIGLLFLFFRKQPGGFVVNLCSLCLFAGWKHSIGREDYFHALTFVYILILVMILFLSVQKKHLHTGMLLFLTAICFYNYNLQYIPGYSNNYFWMPGVINFNDRVIHSKQFKETSLAQTRRDEAGNVLPPEWLKTISSSTTDVFPWDLGIIMINNLNYQPRPCLQSVILTTPNDAADAASLSSANAPQYIIWHITKGTNTDIDGLDQQYIPNTCPATMEAILTNYQLTAMKNDNFAVWEKQTVAAHLQKQKVDSITVSWGDWINVPPHDSNTIIKAKIHYENTLLYSIRSFLYKGLPVFIEYETDSGKILQYSFSKQCAEEGLFINPLWTDNQLHSMNIKRIRVFNNRQQYFTGRVTIILETATINITSK